MSLFAFVIIHQGHGRREINLCLAAFIDPPLENRDHFPRENFTAILRTDGCEAQLTNKYVSISFFLFARCLRLLVKIFINVKNGLMMNPEVEKISICVWLLYCVINFSRFCNGGVKISIKFFSTDVVFFQVHSAVVNGTKPK